MVSPRTALTMLLARSSGHLGHAPRSVTADEILECLRKEGYRIVSPLTITDQASEKPWCIARRGRITVDSQVFTATCDIDRSIAAEEPEACAACDRCVREEIMHALAPLLEPRA